MRAETLKVGGMTCGSCVGAVTKALNAVKGVENVDVSLNSGEARIEFDEGTTSSEVLRATIQRAGYSVVTAGSKERTTGGCCG